MNWLAAAFGALSVLNVCLFVSAHRDNPDEGGAFQAGGILGALWAWLLLTLIGG